MKVTGDQARSGDTPSGEWHASGAPRSGAGDPARSGGTTGSARPLPPEVERQRQYYAATAHEYDDRHLHEGDEHYLALCVLKGALDFLDARSVLDVGSGTGRALERLRSHGPRLRAIGIEPVAELRAIGHRNGIPADDLRDGDVTALDFRDGEFDVVCSFAVLHHVHRPHTAVAEMLRVARKAVFISDSNTYGQGPLLKRTAKQLLRATGLWRAAVFVSTGGRGYFMSEGDGLAYKYSIFDDLGLIERHCRAVHVMNTRGRGWNAFRTAEHVAVLGLKQ
jgi:SAM-dependent methyltransferase